MPLPGGHPPPARPRQSFVARHLDLSERLGEALFGLIMVLSFTLGAGLIVAEGPDATRQMLLGILGCNIAWGLVDGAMYLMQRALERGRKTRLIDAIARAGSEEEALAMIGGELDELVERLASSDERRSLYREVLKRLRHLPAEPIRLTRADLYGALATFWLVFLSTIPAVLPFLVFRDRFVALRVSNALLLVMLFLTGYRWARATRGRPWRFGLILATGGLVLVVIVIALGG